MQIYSIKTVTQQAKKTTGYWIGAIVISLLGLAGLRLTFSQAMTKDARTQSVQDFADRSKQDLLKYLKDGCDRGNQGDCDAYKKEGGQ
jgi:Na+/melibiose symporter-like transporter